MASVTYDEFWKKREGMKTDEPEPTKAAAPTRLPGPALLVENLPRKLLA
jgi:hypothetical protein